MHVSLAAIRLAYNYAMHNPLPGNLPFATAGQQVMDKMGKKAAHKLFADAEAIVQAGVHKDDTHRLAALRIVRTAK